MAHKNELVKRLGSKEFQMGKYKILFRRVAGKQKKSMLGIAFLIFVASGCLFTSLLLSASGTVSVTGEMECLGFGTFTAWINGDGTMLAEEIKSLPDVGEVPHHPSVSRLSHILQK